MTAEQAALFGEPGHRVEREEWGLRYPKGAYLRPSGDGVERLASRESAEFALSDEALRCGHRGCELVRRTVVTYTTAWEAP